MLKSFHGSASLDRRASVIIQNTINGNFQSVIQKINEWQDPNLIVPLAQGICKYLAKQKLAQNLDVQISDIIKCLFELIRKHKEHPKSEYIAWGLKVIALFPNEIHLDNVETVMKMLPDCIKAKSFNDESIVMILNSYLKIKKDRRYNHLIIDKIFTDALLVKLFETLLTRVNSLSASHLFVILKLVTKKPFCFLPNIALNQVINKLLEQRNYWRTDIINILPQLIQLYGLAEQKQLDALLNEVINSLIGNLDYIYSDKKLLAECAFFIENIIFFYLPNKEQTAAELGLFNISKLLLTACARQKFDALLAYKVFVAVSFALKHDTDNSSLKGLYRTLKAQLDKQENKNDHNDSKLQTAPSAHESHLLRVLNDNKFNAVRIYSMIHHPVIVLQGKKIQIETPNITCYSLTKKESKQTDEKLQLSLDCRFLDAFLKEEKEMAVIRIPRELFHNNLKHFTSLVLSKVTELTGRINGDKDSLQNEIDTTICDLLKKHAKDLKGFSQLTHTLSAEIKSAADSKDPPLLTPANEKYFAQTQDAMLEKLRVKRKETLFKFFLSLKIPSRHITDKSTMHNERLVSEKKPTFGNAIKI